MSEEKETIGLEDKSEPAIEEVKKSKSKTKKEVKKEPEAPKKTYRIVTADQLTTIDDGFDKVDRFLNGNDEDEGDDYDGDLSEIGD